MAGGSPRERTSCRQHLTERTVSNLVFMVVHTMQRFHVLLRSLIAAFLIPAAAGAAEQPHIVFMIGEKNYGTAQSLPAFAKQFLGDCKCTFVHADEKDPNHFPGLEALADADLLVLSVRRRTPRKEQMALIRRHLASGKPLVGIRTASHAFGAKPPGADYEAWDAFDVDVLGAIYNRAHPDHPQTYARVSKTALDHPVLKGVPKEETRIISHLYKYRELRREAIPLVYGRVAGFARMEPVAWVNTANPRRVFYTSLGDVNDFKAPMFQRLLLNGVKWALEKTAD